MPNLKIRAILTQTCNVGCPYCYCNCENDTVMSKGIIDRLYTVALKTKEKYKFRGIRLVISGGDPFYKSARSSLQYLIDTMRPITDNWWIVSINPHHGDEAVDFVIKNRIPAMTAVNMDSRVDMMIDRSVRLMKEGLLQYCNLCLVNGKNNERFLEVAEKYIKANLPVHAYIDYDPRAIIVDKDELLRSVDLKGFFDLLEKYEYRYTNVIWSAYQPWRPKKKGGVCGFGESNFQVGPSGEIFNCYALQFSERDDPVHVPCGSIWDEDPIELVKSHADRFGYTEYEEECLVCEYFTYCRGGCVANKYHKNRSYGGKHPYCELNKYAIMRTKKLYEKLDFSKASELGWEVSQEKQGNIPIELSVHFKEVEK
jgi:radical SAM protein with 4Fe4S-binding SPASM domain